MKILKTLVINNTNKEVCQIIKFRLFFTYREVLTYDHADSIKENIPNFSKDLKNNIFFFYIDIFNMFIYLF